MTDTILCWPNGTCVFNNTACLTEERVSEGLNVIIATLIVCLGIVFLFKRFQLEYILSKEYLVDPLPKYSVPKDMLPKKDLMIDLTLPKEPSLISYSLKTMEDITTWMNMPRDRSDQKILQKQVDDYFLDLLKKKDENIVSRSFKVTDGQATTTWGFNTPNPPQWMTTAPPTWSFQTTPLKQDDEEKEETRIPMIHRRSPVVVQEKKEPEGREGDFVIVDK